MEKLLEIFNNYFEVDYNNFDDVELEFDTSKFYYKYGNKLIKNYDIVDKFSDLINWSFLCKIIKLSEDFIDRYHNFLDWGNVSIYQILSESLIRKYKDYVYWTCISEFQILSEDFIREFSDDVSWDVLSASQELSFDFMKEFSDKICWNWLCQYRIITPEFCDIFKDKIYDNLDIIINYQPFIDDYKSKFHKLKDNDIEFGKLYKLYQQTKERGWFFGYIKIDSYVQKKFIVFNISGIDDIYIDEYLYPNTNIFKIKIYWKDLKFTDLIDKYKIIRGVKCL